MVSHLMNLRRTARRLTRRVLRAFAVVILAGAPALGCVVESSRTIAGGSPEAAEAAGNAERVSRGPRPLQLAYTVTRVLSGDTVELSGGRVVHLAGIRTPGPTESHSRAAFDTLAFFLRKGTIVIVAFAADATLDAEVLDALVLVQLTARHREYFTGSGRQPYPQGASVSLSGVMLSSGLARLDPEYESLRFAKTNDEGVLAPYSAVKNEALRDGLRNSRDRASREGRGIWSGSHHD